MFKYTSPEWDVRECEVIRPAYMEYTESRYTAVLCQGCRSKILTQKLFRIPIEIAIGKRVRKKCEFTFNHERV